MPNSAPRPLPRGGVRALLSHLADSSGGDVPDNATGRLVLVMKPGESGSPEASIWMRDGDVYAADLSSFTPPMALRLKSTGCLDDSEYAVIAKKPAADIGPYAIMKYGVSPSLVEELNREVLLATVSHLFDWNEATWQWRDGETTNSFTTSGMHPSLVVSAVDERIGQWRAVTRHYPHAVQPTSVPHAGPGWAAKTGGEVTPELASLLTYVDGRRTVAKIAGACGFTRFEITRLLAQAVADQILVFPGMNDRDRNDTDLAQAASDEARKARGGRAVTQEEVRAAEQKVAEARLALNRAEAELEALLETR